MRRTAFTMKSNLTMMLAIRRGRIVVFRIVKIVLVGVVMSGVCLVEVNGSERSVFVVISR